MLAINRTAPTACTSATANAALDSPVEHREQPVDQVLLVQHVQHAGLAGHRFVEVLVLLGIVELDDERRRERVLARDILVLRELLDRVVVGVVAVQEPNGANVVAGLDLLTAAPCTGSASQVGSLAETSLVRNTWLSTRSR